MHGCTSGACDRLDATTGTAEAGALVRASGGCAGEEGRGACVTSTRENSARTRDGPAGGGRIIYLASLSAWYMQFNIEFTILAKPLRGGIETANTALAICTRPITPRRRTSQISAMRPRRGTRWTLIAQRDATDENIRSLLEKKHAGKAGVSDILQEAPLPI